MAAPKVYRFDDNGAPVLSGADNTKLIALLKACLVDGYGSKPGAGWTMPFIDAAGTTAAFRGNPTNGTGFFLQVSPSGTNKHRYVLRGYESMTGATEGTLPFYPESSQYGVLVSYQSGQSIARPWMVIADDRLFYFLAWNNNTIDDLYTNRNVISAFVFGDAIPWESSDNYFCVLFANQNGGSLAGYDYQTISLAHFHSESNPDSYSSSGQFVARNITGDVNDNTLCNLVFGGGPCSPAPIGYREKKYAADRIQGGEIMSRPYINRGTTHSFRGYLPGLWIPCNKGDDFNVIEQVETGTHRFVVCVGSYTTQLDYIFAFDISEDFRP